MGHKRCAQSHERIARSASALVAMLVLGACAGCGVRADQNLNHAPLPICDNAGPEACQTLENKEAFAAPSWLVRCRRQWLHWRHGHGMPAEEREVIVIPPAPRFHPVPTRPVFAPLEYEAPAGAEIEPVQLPAAPAPPKPQMQFPPEEIPGSSSAPAPKKMPENQPAETPRIEQPTNPPAMNSNESTPVQNAAAAPKLLPRVLMPKASRQISPTPPIRTAAKPNPIESKIPDAPQATEPLAESTSSPAWKPRR